MIQHACKTNCLNCKWLLWVMISDEILKCPILLLFFCFIFHSYFMVVINYFKNQKSKFTLWYYFKNVKTLHCSPTAILILLCKSAMEISEVFEWLNVCQILLVFLLFMKSLPVKTGTMGISYPKCSFYISAFNQTEVTKNRFITYLPENINNQIKNMKQCFYKMLKIGQWLMIPKICEINKMTSSISQLNRTIVLYNERTINYKHTGKDFDIMWFTGEGNGKTLQYSCLENPWTVWKHKKIGHWKMNSPGQYVPKILLEMRGETTPGRMKRWRQSKNNT